MILKKLVLDNFRQYLGRQEIVFASQKQKNVTIIHGENGFGKTCFLNALLWGFYGSDGLTKDLPKPEHIIPDTVREQSTDPSADISTIEISFKHGDREFTLARSISLAQERASKGQNTDLNLAIRHLDGQTTNCDGREAQKIIDSILPRDLRELVFFNGERIDHLAMEDSAEKVRDSVRGLLGLKLIDQSIADLMSNNVRGKLKEDLKKNTDAETSQLLEKQTTLETAIAEKKGLLTACRSNQSALAEKMSAINAKLEANREARELQQRRATRESELTERQKALQDLEKRLGDLLAADGYTLFCSDLIQRGKSITHKLRAEGRIPARVMNDFIHDLLKAETCICGTCLPKDSEIWKMVEEQLTKAGDPEFNRAVGDLDKAIGVIEGSINRTRESITRLVGERTDLIERISHIREDLEEIKEALGSKDDEEVHKLEAQREKEELRRHDLLREEGSLAKEIETSEAELKSLSAEIQTKQQKGEEGKKAQRRLQRLEETVALLEEILQIESEDLRNELGKEVERIFRKISLHDYRLDLTDDFTLRLSKSVPGSSGLVQVDVATSTGQRQVMSLVFIASLVALAQRRNEIPTILKDLHGGDYPLVMDSPFGQLGDEFRAAIAKHVPALAPQAIVLVSTSQYKGDVEHELGESSRVGKRYILRYHAPSKRDDARETITLAGKKTVIFKKDETEHTQIQEVEL
jgi:DNA sulfur modification protein DndD